MGLTFVDWFAGIGGFRYGLEKANKGLERNGQEIVRISGRQKAVDGTRNDNPQTQRSNGCSIGGSHPKGFVCVGACELDKYARRVYARNFGHEPEWGDSTAVDPAGLPDFDLFCAGFPCQSFSVAGKRHGFSDPRGTLFFEIVRICDIKRPRYLLLENVKGLLSLDNGLTFEAILAALSEIGYDCQWEVLNSKNFGVPQNRERVFIIGHSRNFPRPQVFPLGEDGEAPIGDANRSTSYAIDSNYGKGCYTPGRSNTRTMIVHENISGIRTPHREAQALRSGASHNYQTVAKGFCDDRICEPGGIAPTLMSCANTGGKHQAGISHKNPILLGCHLRRLTPTECERLQGFPDGFTEGISDTQRYRCLGNAVTTNVITAIGERLLTNSI